MSKEENENPYFPPDDKPLYPIVITNQIYDEKGIKTVIQTIIENKNLDTLVAVAPFISTYFITMLEKTTIKNLVLIINHDDKNPDYVNNAVKMLQNVSFHVEVRSRPAGSRFVHMKVMIPFISIERVNKSSGKDEIVRKLVPACIITGSVNFTKNGISISDEMLIILRDPYSIAGVFKTYDDLLKNTKLLYDSRSYLSKKRSSARNT